MRDESRYLINLEKLRRYRPDILVRMENASFNQLDFCLTQQGELNLQITNQVNEYFHAPQGAAEEAKKWWESFYHQFHPGHVLIIYGIGLGYYYDEIKKWLKANPKNKIVIFEDNLEVFHFLLQTERATEILDDPQVLLHYTKGSAEERFLLEEVIRSCFDIHGIDPYISIVTFPYYARAKKEFSDLFTRRMLYLVETFRVMKESFWDQSLIVGNYYSNLLLLPYSRYGNELAQKFEKIPAIICGAGPSLEKNSHLLKNLENRALIFAGGTAINVLGHHGITPHFGVGIDPNLSHYARVLTQDAFEVPFFFTYRMHHQAIKQLQAPILFLTKQKTNFEEWFNRELNFPVAVLAGGHSVGNVSLQIAELLGCDPIVFVGMDLAWTDQKPYAEGVLDHPVVALKKHYNQSKSLYYQDKDLAGKPTKTTFQFVKEIQWISHFISKHPGITYINATEGGKSIPEMPNQTLSEVSENFMHRSYDLRNQVYQEILNIHHPFLSLEKVRFVELKWHQSCENCQKLLKEDIHDLEPFLNKQQSEAKLPVEFLNRMSLREMDLRGEDAYFYYLKFFDANVCAVLKAQENHWLRKQGKELGGDQLELSIDHLDKRYRFLLNRIETNLHEMDRCIKKLKDPQNQLGMGSPANEGSGKIFTSNAIYSFQDGKLKIDDPDCEIFLEETFSVNLQPSNDIQDGVYQKTYPSGLLKSEMVYKEGHLHGPCRFYSENGILFAHSWFIEGKRHGKTWQYYPSGALYSLQRFHYGLKHGRQEFFYEDGKKRTILPYILGNLEGIVLLYHPDGTLKREIHYQEGKRHGIEKIWYENGYLLLEANFQKGFPVETFRSWYINGHPEMHIVFRAPNQIASVKEWDEQGKMIQEKLKGDE